MELEHTFVIPTSVESGWDLILDLERVGSCFPGAIVTEATDTDFSGTVKVKLGPIALVYAGAGSFTERDASNHRAVIEARGKDKRGNGTAAATVVITLSDHGDGTQVDVKTDLAITGKPAQFGRGVMQDVSDALLAQFTACIEQQFTPQSEPKGGRPSEIVAQVPASLSEETKSRHASPPTEGALNLGAAVLPVLAKRYTGLALAALLGGIVGWLVGHRRR